MGRLWASAVPGGGGLVPDVPWEPAGDIEETDDAYVLELDLPGLRKDQVSVEVLDSELAVHGEVKEKERTGVVRRQTRRVGQFDYRMSLPADADAERISAELTNGVLTVHVPRAEKAKPRRIEITS
ncbi:Hsp20/alpha crystallin family protein [Streptomyces sp. ISL-96]|uniref:Hsp20/alpha crystallin family protein n=1 Tax=Streptomyces sp. ISL-96 TaxID=2819191 RepID=UPI001BE7F945|nr:Hsp20/alpha crystallin family protein [Streptomyces sp. ISL-96]MBT2493237.1 Hsp20/alpha crystallin family protein [Streptomyces sp. ISL-96]